MTVPRDVLTLIDGTLRGRALVFGSLPPDARDLDLLVRADDEATLARLLASNGFEGAGRTWVSFRGCDVTEVELIPLSTLGLPAAEAEKLLEEGVPIPPASRVVQPSPHHTLLILAWRLARTHGPLAEKHRTRVDGALRLDPDAWERAGERAEAWNAHRALEDLRAAHAGKPKPGRARIRLPRRACTLVFSGADDAATRDQAEALRKTLERLGFTALVEVFPHGVGGIRHAIARWKSLVPRRGRRAVTIFVEPPHGHISTARLLSPRPLRRYLVDTDRRTREEMCEEFARDVWRAVNRRVSLDPSRLRTRRRRRVAS